MTANCETPNDTSTHFFYDPMGEKQHILEPDFIASVQMMQHDN